MNPLPCCRPASLQRKPTQKAATARRQVSLLGAVLASSSLGHGRARWGDTSGLLDDRFLRRWRRRCIQRTPRRSGSSCIAT